MLRSTIRLAVAIYVALLVWNSPSWGFSIPKPIPGANETLPFSGSSVVVKGLTNQANHAFINAREAIIQKDGWFNEIVLIPLGETEIVVEVVDPAGKKSEYRKKIKAKENAFFLAGIADGTLNFVDISQPDEDAGFRLERDNHQFYEGFTPEGKISYYSTGKLQGKYYFKSAVDTDKTTESKLFTYIDPDKYYPIYGDDSTVVYDVNSQGKFYALFEKDKSGAVFGNYQTQIGEEDSKFLTYNRTLYGGKVHIQTNKNTIYGDPITKATAYAAKANQQAGHSELLATGGSLYYLRHRNISEGSEQVHIEVRDKVTGMTLYTTPQSRDVDYEIKYDEGRILFKKPILSVAPSDTIISSSVLEGNPVFVVSNYEYNSQDMFPISEDDFDTKTAGFRVSQQFGDHVRVGGLHLQEEKDGKYHKLLGADTTVKVGNFTRLNAEIARSTADSRSAYFSYNGGYRYSEVSTSNLEHGTALRVEGNSSLGEYFGKEKGFLDLSAYWQRIDAQFSPVDSLFEAGTRKFGMEAAHKFSENDQVRLLYHWEQMEQDTVNSAAENQLQARRAYDFTTQWVHEQDKWTFITEALYKIERVPLGPIIGAGKGRASGYLVGERVQYDWSEKTSLFLGQQVGLNDLNDSFTSGGFSRRLSDQFTLHGQAGAGPMGNSVMAGIERYKDAKHSEYWNFTRSDLYTDGKTSITSFGSNTKISETGSLRKERQFVTSDRGQSYAAHLTGYENEITPELSFDFSVQRRDEKQTPNTISGSEARDATSAGLSFIRPDKVKFYSKAEHRLNSDDIWQIFTDNQGELKLTKDLFLFAEHEYSYAAESSSRIDKKHVGIAIRPVNFDWFNALFKFIRLTDDRPKGLTSADGGFTTMQSQSDVLAGEYALDLVALPGLLKRFQIVQKLAWKDEHLLTADMSDTVHTPVDQKVLLSIHRLNYHLTNRFDLAAEWRRLRKKGKEATERNREAGLLVELTFKIIKHVAVGAGFNFTDFNDDLTTQESRSGRGFFLRLQGTY